MDLATDRIKDAMIRHQILIQRLAAGQYDATEVFIEDVIERSIKRINTLKYLNVNEAKTLEQELLHGFRNMNKVALDNLKDFANYEAEFTAKLLKAEPVSPEIVEKDLLNNRMQIGLATNKNAASLEVTLDRFARLKSREIVRLIRKGSIKKLSKEEIVDSVKKLEKKIKAQAKTLANTATNHAATIGKESVYLANKKDIKFVQWISVLDNRTTEFCRGQNKKIYPVNKGPRPPANFNCFDKKTDVFTNEGWKNWQDVTGNELFLSVNLETGDAEFVKAVELIKYKFTGDMDHYSGHRVDIMTTPNHMHVVKFRKKNKGRSDSGYWKLVSGEDLPNHDFNFLASIPNWKGKPEEILHITGKPVSSVDFMKFLGIFLSEGSIHLANKNAKTPMWRISIHQEKYFDEMLEVCENCFEKVTGHKNSHKILIYRLTDEIINLLHPLGHSHQKYLPKQFKEYDVEHCEAFLQWFALGDGSFQKASINGYTCKALRGHHTTSVKLVDDLSELILKVGKRPCFNVRPPRGAQHWNGYYVSNNDIWNVREGRSISHSRERMKKEKIRCDDFVYDVTLEKYHTLIVRRNNKTFVSGNCRSLVVPLYE